MEGLIDSVRSYPCLWRVHLKEYKDLHVKENAWKKVAEETGLSQEDCQKHWKRLRDRFVRELKKVKHLVSGDEGPLYVPAWEYFELLNFLAESVKHRQ